MSKGDFDESFLKMFAAPVFDGVAELMFSVRNNMAFFVELKHGVGFIFGGKLRRFEIDVK
jgi:hypothetical protein